LIAFRVALGNQLGTHVNKIHSRVNEKRNRVTFSPNFRGPREKMEKDGPQTGTAPRALPNQAKRLQVVNRPSRE
jgi:hypothetical protein